MSEPTRIYDDTEMTILRAALNLLREGQSRTIDAMHGKQASGETWEWIAWSGMTYTAADSLNSVVFRHDRYTEPVPEPQSLRAPEESTGTLNMITGDVTMDDPPAQSLRA